jgi:protein-tyrosine-phosphatase/DNA-binding transcriptional ArsR family regulator
MPTGGEARGHDEVGPARPAGAPPAAGDGTSDRTERAAWHHALADPHRLAIVDMLELSDATPSEVAERTGMPSNLVAFHLDVLEEVGIVVRHRSQGDGRRRYVTLGPRAPRDGGAAPAAEHGRDPVHAERVVFVCTHNSARSQLAAAMWTSRTGRDSWSAGSAPADHVNPHAVAVARDHGLDISSARPHGYDDVEVDPDLVVSVCDRVREDGLPFTAPQLHWSIPEPVAAPDFPTAWEDLDRRITRLAARSAAA